MLKQHFIELFTGLCHKYGVDVTTLRMEQCESWWYELQHRNDNDIESAYHHVATTSQRFPSLAELVTKLKTAYAKRTALEDERKRRKQYDQRDIQHDGNNVPPETQKVLWSVIIDMLQRGYDGPQIHGVVCNVLDGNPPTYPMDPPGNKVKWRTL